MAQCHLRPSGWGNNSETVSTPVENHKRTRDRQFPRRFWNLDLWEIWKLSPDFGSCISEGLPIEEQLRLSLISTRERLPYLLEFLSKWIGLLSLCCGSLHPIAFNNCIVNVCLIVCKFLTIKRKLVNRSLPIESKAKVSIPAEGTLLMLLKHQEFSLGPAVSSLYTFWWLIGQNSSCLKCICIFLTLFHQSNVKILKFLPLYQHFPTTLPQNVRKIVSNL